MDQSGSRYSSLNLKSPIIHRPDLQTPRQRTLYGTLTAVFWAAWIYLWVPLLALLAWAVGIQQAHKYMVELDGYHRLGHVLELYALIITLLGGMLLIWASYNILRFRGPDKRSARAQVSSADIGRDLNHEEQQVARWHGERLLVVRYDDHGQVAEVRAGTPGRLSEVLPPLPRPEHQATARGMVGMPGLAA